MLVSESARLVDELAQRLPKLQDAYDSHVFNEGGVLPHVSFWDVTQEVVRSFISGGDEALVTSFLHYLPYPTQPGYGLVDELGAVMSGRFRDLRGR